MTRPGVTRDRREADGRLGDLDLTLIDTAGFEDVRDASLEARMRVQTEAAVADADVVVLMIDARVGVTPLDETFAALLRRANKPVVLVANKCEGRAGTTGLNEAYALGLGEPIGLSAEHGEGMAELYAAIVAASGAQESGPEGARTEDKPIRIAVIGRPNAGKSTLVNALIGEDRLLVGPEAGITRDAIAVDWVWRGKKFRLVDTAGMRKKAKVQAKLERLSVGETLHAIRFADVCVLVMDAAEAFEKQDLTIADLVVREGRGLVFALAKWDKIEDTRATFRGTKARRQGKPAAGARRAFGDDRRTLRGWARPADEGGAGRVWRLDRARENQRSERLAPRHDGQAPPARGARQAHQAALHHPDQSAPAHIRDALFTRR